jgi:hypothetical protein
MRKKSGLMLRKALHLAWTYGNVVLTGKKI